MYSLHVGPLECKVVKVTIYTILSNDNLIYVTHYCDKLSCNFNTILYSQYKKEEYIEGSVKKTNTDSISS